MNFTNTPYTRAAFCPFLACLCVAAWAGLPARGAEIPERPEFNRHVRPILADNCFKCHGFDKNTRKADLRLDVADSAYAPGPEGAAIVPGDAQASGIIRRIFTDDPDDHMPPPESELSLTDAQKETLRRWVEQGAEYQPHWSLIPPVRPVLPETTAKDDWVRTPADAFVLNRMRARGIEPSPPADPVTLARRVHFDLTGLPPSVATVDAFAANPSDAAYAQMVDTLLASPAYGERMAADWLDQVRYADTNGYHSDEFRSMWPYRDYVIKAFNENKPFDQFTIEQIAGDLLPDATREQQVAASYNRLNQITAEGGAQAKEYLAMYAADRVRTLSSVWLGATMGCAECHDHKYDPYTTKDFYSLAAFFADIEEVGVYEGGSKWEPVLYLPNEAQEEEEARLRELIAGHARKLTEPSPELAAGQAKWEEEIRAQLLDTGSDWSILPPESVSSANGTEFRLLDSGAVLTHGPNPDTEVYTATLAVEPGKLRGVRLEALMHPEVPQGLSYAGNFVLTEVELELQQEGGAQKLEIDRAQADYEQQDHPIATAYDGKSATGWAVDGHKLKDGNEDRAAMFLFRKSVEVKDGARLIVRLRHESQYPKHNIGCFRLAVTGKMRPALNDQLGLPRDIYTIVRIDPGLRTADEAGRLAEYYREIAPELDPIRKEIKAAEEQIAALQAEIPYVLQTKSVEPRVMRVLPRGNWMDESGEIVTPLTPAALPGLPERSGPYTRLDLAQWLVSEQNPLTARVFVNRLWDMYFGTGLSKVLDDLGGQGEVPTHPDLLDWLAVEFRESGWDVKHMVRLIVLSSAYRQDSRPRPELNDIDPYNRLLARQARLRLEAEMVRDTALSVSGLLARKLGGPSVFPYQPDGYWDDCNTFRGPLIYTASEGEDQYRRGLYTVWKRSFLHPSMLAFDAPSREECTAKRVTSSTPLQALTLLNDPTYVEAARVFAARVLRECAGTDGERIAWAFRVALSREASARETAVLLELLHQHRAEYEQDVASAEAVLGVGFAPRPDDLPAREIAAWTSITRAILNLNETVTRS